MHFRIETSELKVTNNNTATINSIVRIRPLKDEVTEQRFSDGDYHYGHKSVIDTFVYRQQRSIDNDLD